MNNKTELEVRLEALRLAIKAKKCMSLSETTIGVAEIFYKFLTGSPK